MYKQYEITVRIMTLATDMHNAENIALSRLDDTGLAYIHDDTEELLPRFKYTFDIEKTGRMTIRANSQEEAEAILSDMEDGVIDDQMTGTSWTLAKVEERES